MKLITKIISPLAILATVPVVVLTSCGNKEKNFVQIQFVDETEREIIKYEEPEIKLNEELRIKYEMFDSNFDINIDKSSIKFGTPSFSLRDSGCYLENNTIVVPKERVTDKIIVVTLKLYNKNIVSFRNLSTTNATTVTINFNSSDFNLSYISKDQENWTKITDSTTTHPFKITIDPNQEFYLKGTNETLYYNDGTQRKVSIKIESGSLFLEGNIMGLLDDGQGKQTKITKWNCFHSVFEGSSGIINVTKGFLPAQTLSVGCYTSLFSNCKNLLSTPILNATNIESSCYQDMFYGCTNLISSYLFLPSVLKSSCCLQMFMGCDKLKNVESLPKITQLEAGCFSSMFSGCKALSVACNKTGKKLLLDLTDTPTPSSTSLQNMFDGCNCDGFEGTPEVGNKYYLN